MNNSLELKSLFLIMAILFSRNVKSFWNNEQINHASKYNSKFQDPHIDTLSGLCETSKYKESLIKGKVLTFYDKLPNLVESEVHYKLVLHGTKEISKKSPLMIVLAGAFGDTDGTSSKMWMQHFSNLGYHTLILPNPLSIEFLNSTPLFPIGDFLKEAKSLFELSKNAINYLKKNNLLTNEIQITGLSHGAFLSTIVNFLFTKEGINIDKVTAFAPPVNIKNSFSLLDNQIEESYSFGLKGSLMKILAHFNKICKSSKYEDLENETIKYAQYIALVNGFQRSLVNSLIEYDEINNLGIVPLDNLERERWKKEMNFRKYFDQFSPELLSLYYSEKSELTYWIYKNWYYGKQNVRVLLSDDDFINYSPTKTLDNSIFLYINGGGHFGYRSTKWFEELLKLSF